MDGGEDDEGREDDMEDLECVLGEVEGGVSGGGRGVEL